MQTDRRVWVLLEDRSVWGYLTEWFWTDRLGWIGRVQFIDRWGNQKDWLVLADEVRPR